MSKSNRIAAVLGFMAFVAWGIGGAAHADSVLLGADYLHTLPGTYFDFGGPIGSVSLTGVPISPGTLGDTDTIVHRKADAFLPIPGVSMDTVPIELVQLSLMSVAPVNIGGFFYDVSVYLTPFTSSTGTMTIRHEGLDNGTPAPEGTFDSFFDVFFTADFTEVGNPINTFQIPDHIQLGSTGSLWSHEPIPGALQVTGSTGNQAANDHTARPPLFNDFHVPGQIVEMKLPPDSGAHFVRAAFGPQSFAQVPEPSTLLLLGLGGLTIWACLKRRTSA